MAVAFLLLVALLVPGLSHAADLQSRYKEIQQKMVEQKEKIGEAQGRESSILGDIEEVSRKLALTETELNRQRRALRQTESGIRDTNGKIAHIESSLSARKNWIKRKLRVMQRFGYSGDLLMVLLNARDASQMIRVWRDLEAIAAYDNKVLDDYRQNLEELNKESSRLRSLKSELLVKTRRVAAEEKELAEQRSVKEALLSSVREEKNAHRKMLMELREASRKLLDIIRESYKRNSYTGKGFSRLKGKLHWPVAGVVAIPYGPQKDRQFDTPVFRNGIHIKTAPDADVSAVFGGRVIFSDWFKGYGQLIIVNNGEGYNSLYGNLSQIFSHVGDIIKNNQVIGKVGTSGILNAPGLYFEIRYKGRPLDPTQWLVHKRR
ncbi:MAG: peptidoglycan DD-metalloendopeptidase family protein [Candidatus Sulfobium sp.]